MLVCGRRTGKGRAGLLARRGYTLRIEPLPRPAPGASFSACSSLCFCLWLGILRHFSEGPSFYQCCGNVTFFIALLPRCGGPSAAEYASQHAGNCTVLRSRCPQSMALIPAWCLTFSFSASLASLSCGNKRLSKVFSFYFCLTL